MPLTHFPRRHPGHANRGFKSRRLQLEPLEERALLALALWDVAITIEGDPDPSTPSFSGDGTGVGRVVYNTESSDGTFLGVGDGTVTITGPDAEGKPAEVSGAIEGMGYAGSVQCGAITFDSTYSCGGGYGFTFEGQFGGTTATLSRENPSGQASGRWTAHVTLPYFESPPYPDNIPGEVDLAGDWSSTTLQLVGDIDVTDGLQPVEVGQVRVSFAVKEPLSHDDSPWCGEALAASTTVEVYWATGESANDIVLDPIATYDTGTQAHEHTYFLDIPPDPPDTTEKPITHIVMIADPPDGQSGNDAIYETNEDNNVCALSLTSDPTIEVILEGPFWKNEEHDVSVRVTNNSLINETFTAEVEEAVAATIDGNGMYHVEQPPRNHSSSSNLQTLTFDLAPSEAGEDSLGTSTHSWDWIPQNPADPFYLIFVKDLSALVVARSDRQPAVAYKYTVNVTREGGPEDESISAEGDLVVGMQESYAMSLEKYHSLVWQAQLLFFSASVLDPPLTPIDHAIYAALYGGALFYADQASRSYEQAKDPPDPDYTVEVEATWPDTPVLEWTGAGCTRKLLEAHLDVAAALDAARRAHSKADGAKLAGDVVWQTTQLLAASHFDTEAAIAATRAIGLQTFTQPFIDANGTTWEDVVQRLVSEGFSDRFVELLECYGATPSEIDELLAQLVAQDFDETDAPLAPSTRISATSAGESAMALFEEAIDLRVRKLQLPVADVSTETRVLLEEARAKIEQELQSPTALPIDLRRRIAAYIDDVRSQIIATNNFTALADALQYGFAALTALQEFDASSTALSVRVDALGSQGRIESALADQLRNAFELVDQTAVSGAFDDALPDLEAAASTIVTHWGDGIEIGAAAELLGHVSLMRTLLVNGAMATSVIGRDDQATVAAGIATPIQVSANDQSGSATTILKLVEPSSHGTAAVDDAGTPNDYADDFIVYASETGYRGLDRFRYAVIDLSNWEISVATVEVMVEEYATLGVLDFRELKALSLAVGELRFGLTTAHAGFLTFEVANPQPAESARIHLYDENPGANPAAVPVASSSLVEGNQRLDWTVAQGQAYFVELYGENPQFDLRVVNLVHALGGQVTVTGTDGDDRFEFVPVGSHRVTINGVAYHFAEAEAQNVTFDGGDGHDTAVLRGGAGVDTVEMWPGQATLSGPGYTVAATKVETVTAVGTSEDVAVLYGSDQGGDLFSARPGSASLSGEAGFWNRAVGFGQVEAVATPGGALVDTAKFYDSDGIDLFEATPEYARMTYDDGSTARTTGFGYVVGKATAGGNDLAQLYDSPDGKDWFSGRLGYSKLYGTGFFNVALDFDRVRATATPGQFDRAAVYDSEGDDRLEATPEYARLLFGGSESAFVEAAGFPVVRAVATEGGYNTADLYDSDTGAETFVAYRDYSVLKGAGFCNYATGFSLVTGHASPDDGFDDRAKLCDSDGDDVFYAGPTSPEGTKLVAHPTSGPSYVNAAEGFYRVVAYSSEGNDRAELYDSDTSLDTFVGQPSSSSIYGPGFFHTAVGFAEVYAHASPDDGFEDRAKLYDSDGNDTFWAGPSSPEGNRLDGTTLAGHGFSYAVDGFFQIIGHSYAGGDDEARLYGADGSQDFLRAFFASDYSEMYDSATYKTTAKGFAKTTAYGVKSDADRAILYDSALDEYLEADATKDPTRAILSNSDRILEMYGFAHVKAYRSAGNDTKHVVEPLDFVLQTVGDWIDM